MIPSRIMLAFAILVLRIGSHKYPSVRTAKTVAAAPGADKPT